MYATIFLIYHYYQIQSHQKIKTLKIKFYLLAIYKIDEEMFCLKKELNNFQTEFPIGYLKKVIGPYSLNKIRTIRSQ